MATAKEKAEQAEREAAEKAAIEQEQAAQAAAEQAAQEAAAKAAIEQGADYIAFGRFYPSMTKPGDIFADTSLIAAIKSIVDIPVVGIGGITVDNAAPLIEAGLDAIAVISALFSPSQTAVSESCYEKIKERAAAFSSLFR